MARALAIALTALAILSGVAASFIIRDRETCIPPGETVTEATDDQIQGTFSENYTTARRRFIDSVAEAGGSLVTMAHPAVDSSSEGLAIDVALLGDRSARKHLVVISGTHGVEGYAGSAIQSGLLLRASARELPGGVSLLLVHALNPYGMAHRRRFNEENVDLNRNFRDHGTTPSGNEPYDLLAESIAPKSLSLVSELVAWSRLYWHRLIEGHFSLQTAVSRGQYRHPEGLFYGGTQPTWSNTMLGRIVDRFLDGATEVVIVDIHTGLGSFGDSVLIVDTQEGEPEYRRAANIWGFDRLVARDTRQDTVVLPPEGTLKDGIKAMLDRSTITAVTLEFGTYGPRTVFRALRRENWHHFHGTPDDPATERAKQCLLESFYPGSQRWRRAVLEQGTQTIESALSYLRSSEASETARPSTR